jgi:hypothetical protein
MRKKQKKIYLVNKFSEIPIEKKSFIQYISHLNYIITVLLLPLLFGFLPSNYFVVESFFK